MSEIRYNQASTFGQVLIAGMFASQLLPIISQTYAKEPSVKSLSIDIYRTTNNTATYSYLDSPVTGEYSHAIGRLEYSNIVPELIDFLHHSQQVSLEALEHLLVAIRTHYGDVGIKATLYIDPEDGEIQPVVIVHSGIKDFDRLLDVEDSFFAKAEADPILLVTLPFVTISQV